MYASHDDGESDDDVKSVTAVLLTNWEAAEKMRICEMIIKNISSEIAISWKLKLQEGYYYHRHFWFVNFHKFMVENGKSSRQGKGDTPFNILCCTYAVITGIQELFKKKPSWDGTRTCLCFWISKVRQKL